MKNTNKKSPWRWPCLIAAIVSGGALLYNGLTQLLARTLIHSYSITEGATIGIIGGADGPTAIFVTSSYGPGIFWFRWALPALVLILGLIGYFRLRRCAKK